MPWGFRPALPLTGGSDPRGYIRGFVRQSTNQYYVSMYVQPKLTSRLHTTIMIMNISQGQPEIGPYVSRPGWIICHFSDMERQDIFFRYLIDIL